MGGGRGRTKRRPRAGRAEAPIPLEPVDLLAGLAPGLELQADDVPAGLDREAPDPGPAWMTVAEAGKLIRSGEATVRRLIRTPELRPLEPGEEPEDAAAGDPERAGVLPPTRGKPGE